MSESFESQNINLEKESRKEKLRPAIAGLSLYLMSGCSTLPHVSEKEQLEKAVMDYPAGELVLRLVEGVRAEDCADIAPDVYKQLSHELENEWGFTMKKVQGTWRLANFGEGEKEQMVHRGLDNTEGVEEVCHLHSHPLSNLVEAEILNQKKYYSRDFTREEINELMKQIELIKSGELPTPYYGPSWDDLGAVVRHAGYYDEKSEVIETVHLVATPSGTWTLTIEDDDEQQFDQTVAANTLQKMDGLKEKNLENGEKNEYWQYVSGYLKSKWLYPVELIEEYRTTGDTARIDKFHAEEEKASHTMIEAAKELGIEMKFKPYPNN